MTPLYSLAQAAEILNVPQSWLRRGIATGEIPHVRLGRHVRLSEAHLAAVIAQAERAGSAPPVPVSPTGRLRRHPRAPQ